jgi:hypothetical protein
MTTVMRSLLKGSVSLWRNRFKEKAWVRLSPVAVVPVVAPVVPKGTGTRPAPTVVTALVGG